MQALARISGDGNPLSSFTYLVNGQPGQEGVDYITDYVYNSSNDTCLALLNSGVFIPARRGRADIFLVGGGGSGAAAFYYYANTSGMRGLTAEAQGNGGGVTSLTGGGLDLSANGGNGGRLLSLTYNMNGPAGGSGGAGGNGVLMRYEGDDPFNYWGAIIYSTGGSNGVSPAYAGPSQGRTTRAFGESNGILFAGGGGASGTCYVNGYQSSNHGVSVAGDATATNGINSKNNEGQKHSSSAPANKGGGSGGSSNRWYSSSCSDGYPGLRTGGAGGYTVTELNKILKGDTQYAVTIGKGGNGAVATRAQGSSISGNGGSGIVLIRQHI